jgi:phosphodiesterase/alkaline phosphatase D-like protein
MKETSLVLLIIRLPGQIRLLQDVDNKHWEYNRADPHLQSLLRNTSMYPQANDHEVVNDYGAKWSY